MVDSLDDLSIDALCNFSSYLGRVSQGVNKLSLNEIEDSKNFKGAIFGLNSSSLIQNESCNLQIPILENGKYLDPDLFIQNTDTLGLISLSLDSNKLLILGSDVEQLNLAIKDFPNTISPNPTFILKDGEYIDYLNQLDKLEDMEDNTKTIEMDIIIALSVLIAFIIIVFALYYRKVR